MMQIKTNSNHATITKIIFLICVEVLLLIPLTGYLILAGGGKFSDNYYGKDKLVYLGNNIRYWGFKDIYFRDLIATRSGWLIYAGEDSLKTYQNTDLFSNDQLHIYRDKLTSLCEYSTNKNSLLLFVIAPNKNTIYPEKIPNEIPVINSRSRVDQIMRIFPTGNSCKLINLESALLAAKKTDPVYYATDTHWNDLGAYLAYNEITREIQSNYSHVTLHNVTDYNVTSVQYSGDLTSKVFGQLQLTENTNRLTPKYNSGVYSYSIKDAENLQDTILTISQNEQLPNALIYRDSFFSSVIPFIKDDFHEAWYEWSNRIDFKKIDEHKPSILVVEVTERYLEIFLNYLP